MPAPANICVRVAEALPQRAAVRGAVARELDLAGALRHCHCAARSRSGPRPRAGSGPGLSPCRALAGAVSVTNPLAVTRAYRGAPRHARRGVVDRGDARIAPSRRWHWRVDTAAGPLDAARSCSRSARWLPDAWRRSASDSRSRSSAAITSISVRPGGSSTARSSTSRTAIASRRWSRGLGVTTGVEIAARDAPDSGPARAVMRRWRGHSSLSASQSRRRRGWGPVLLLRISVQSSAAREVTRTVARLWSCPLGPHARSRHRPAPGRDDDRCDAILRSHALRGGTVHAVVPAPAKREPEAAFIR